MWNRIKRSVSSAWTRFKAWFLSIMVAVGLIAGGAVLAQEKIFAWTNPTLNEDGTAYDPGTEQAESRIYCGDDPALFVTETPGFPQASTPDVVTPGAGITAAKDFLPGNYSCFATVVSIYGYESGPSNVTTFTVTPTVPPSAITDFSVN